MTDTMRAARLHGVGDLRVETLDVPRPGRHDLLVRVEACGICPTDVRKYAIGSRDGYPLNPGHEWVGTVADVGRDTPGWSVGQRVCGDTYAGYAEYALLSIEPGAWSNGALTIPDDLDVVQATFVEPLADCVHAVQDQAQVAQGSRVCVVGAGQMGLQMVAVAAAAGAHVTVVEPHAARLELAREFGAAETADSSELAEAAAGRDAVILTIGAADLVSTCVGAVVPGGRVVLFAGFGAAPQATLDLDVIHYREVSLVGSEWIGTPPNQRRERYADALDLITSGQVPVERLVSGEVGLEGIERAYAAVREQRGLKYVLRPWQRT
ncbi:MAG: zinc-binding dehydrogenase [Actinomycetota bacterium]|nr:zinc-binding dehydrogenase [Actinomycetota bacterium]